MDLQSMHDVLDEARQTIKHVVDELETHTPAIEQGAAAVLAAAGAPLPIVTAVDALMNELVNHFRGQAVTAAAAAASTSTAPSSLAQPMAAPVDVDAPAPKVGDVPQPDQL